MYIHLYALYIETYITSNMYIHLYAWYIEEQQGVRIPDERLSDIKFLAGSVTRCRQEGQGKGEGVLSLQVGKTSLPSETAHDAQGAYSHNSLIAHAGGLIPLHVCCRSLRGVSPTVDVDDSNHLES